MGCGGRVRAQREGAFAFPELTDEHLLLKDAIVVAGGTTRRAECFLAVIVTET